MKGRMRDCWECGHAPAKVRVGRERYICGVCKHRADILMDIKRRLLKWRERSGQAA
jgi:hypothetical protein